MTHSDWIKTMKSPRPVSLAAWWRCARRGDIWWPGKTFTMDLSDEELDFWAVGQYPLIRWPMSDLIEDEDGAPYPQCRHCPDQVAPPGTGSNPKDWAHIYGPDDGGPGRWFLNSCQRPFVGRYGDHQAEPD